MDENKWLEGTSLPAPTDGRILPSDIVAQWRDQGFALVDGLIPLDLIERTRADAAAAYPDAGAEDAEEMNHYGAGPEFVFPMASDAANEVTLHPNLIGASAELLGIDRGDLRLTQSDLWPKYGREEGAAAQHAWDNQDQRIHVDYPNHTLTHPTPWNRPEGVEIIIYYDDVEDVGGPTAVVPREGPDDPAYPWPIVTMPGVGGLPYLNDRGAAETHLRENAPGFAKLREEHLYPRERMARFRRGSVLLYRHDTWHRGTPILPGRLRIVQNLAYRKASAEWLGVLHVGWVWSMYRPNRTLEKLIAKGTTDQRTVLGFPPPGSDYWCHETIAAVEARYAPLEIDLGEIRAALER